MALRNTWTKAPLFSGVKLHVMVASVSAFLLGCVVLLGWGLEVEALKSVLPGFPVLLPNTAVALVLAGLSLWLQRRETPVTALRRIAQTCALAVGVIGAITLCEYVFGWEAGIDRLLFRESVSQLTSSLPGRPSFLTALNLSLLGIALLLLDSKSPQESRPSELLTTTVMLISLLALIGHACNVPSFYSWRSVYPTKGMALPITLVFIVFSAGLLFARTDRGLARILISSTASGRMARWLLLTPAFIPLATGLLKTAGIRTGFINAELASWLFAFSNIFLLTGAIWWSSRLLYGAEMTRQRAEDELAKMNLDLERRVVERTAEVSEAMATLRQSEERVRLVLDMALDAVITMNRHGVVTSWNHEAEKTFGWNRAEIVGRKLADTIIPSRYRQAHEESLQRFLESQQGALLNKRIEINALHREGHDISVELAITPIKIGDDFFFSAFARDITGRKQAEGARRSAEAKFRGLVEQSIVGIYVIQNGRFVYVNPKMAEIFGCSREELTSAPLLNFIFEEDRALAEKNIEKRLSGEVASIHYTLRMVRKDGQVINVEVHGSRTEYHGEPAILGTLLDVTEQKQAEETLRAAEQKYRSIFDNAVEGIFQSTPDGKFLAANPAMARILGYDSAEELIRERTDIARQGYVDPAQREKFKQQLEQTGDVSGFQYEAYQKNGRRIWVSENVRVIRDASGELLYYEGSLEDITKRRRAEQRLAGQHAVTAALAESAPLPETCRHILQIICENLHWDLGAMWVVDGTAKVMRCLETWHSSLAPCKDFVTATKEMTFARGMGLPGSVWAKREPLWIGDVTEDSNFPRKSFIAQSVLRGALSFPICFRGEILAVAEFYCTEMREPDPELLAMCATIGSQIGQFMDRKKIEEQLRQSQKMEAIGTLAGGIAHDFNNILTAIVGNAEMLKKEIRPDEPAHECTMEIVRATERASDLVGRILAFSRKQDQKRSVIRLQAVVSEALGFLRASLPATIEIRKSIDADCPAVLADPTQIHQVVMNLATNAAYAMRHGEGCLEISLSCFEADSDFARAHAPLQTGRCVRLQVADTGCGMEAATVERIFEPFFTTKPPGEGTGLGLSVVHGIVRSHDGAITVQSEPGKGAAFNLFFPIASDVNDKVAAPAQSPVAGNGQRILFVDDEKSIGHLAKILLPKIGYSPTVCDSAVEASVLFRADPDRFDAVITDLTMPQMTGMMLAREIHSVRPQLPIILTTGYSGGVDLSQAREAGIQQLLTKPFSLQSLAENLHQVLTRQ